MAALAISVLSVPLANADDLKDRRERVEGKIDHAHDELQHSSARMRRAMSRLHTAQAALAGARAELAAARDDLDQAREWDLEMAERLERARQRLAQAQAELARGRADLVGQREAVTDLVTTIYQQGDPQLRAFVSVLNAENPADLTWAEEARHVVVGQETRVYDELRAAEVLLDVREQQVAAAEEEVEVRREEAADHLVVTRDLTEQAREAKAAVLETVVVRRDAKQRARSARQHDLRELRQLRQEERRIKRLIMVQARRAARQAARAARSRASRSVVGGGGFLSRPVPGPVTSPFGYRTHPIYGYYALHNGTDFRAYCGTPLRAAAGGRVLARYYSSSYGNRLFLNVGAVNGKNLTVVYNHASGYRVGVGQSVARGEVLGYSGNTGWSTACHLHFTVLVNGKPVNPMNWM